MSCGWLSLSPAAVIRTSCPRSCRSGDGGGADEAHGRPQPADELVGHRGERAAVGHLALDALAAPACRRTARRPGSTGPWSTTGAWPRDCIAPSEPIPRYDLNCLPLMKISSPGLSSQPASRLAEHDGVRAGHDRLGDVARILHAAVADHRHAGRPAARAASMIAVTCGTPTPATTRVVQIEPGPTPTLTASAPASTSACAPARSRRCRRPCRRRSVLLEPGDHLQHLSAVPVRGVHHQDVDPGLDQGAGPLVDVLADPDRGGDPQPAGGSLVACGNFSLLAKSLTVIRPREPAVVVDDRQLLHLVLAQQGSASSLVTPTGAVTSGIGVMISRTGGRSVTNRMSRLVTMPTSTPSASTTGTPEMR